MLLEGADLSHGPCPVGPLLHLMLCCFAVVDHPWGSVQLPIPVWQLPSRLRVAALPRRKAPWIAASCARVMGAQLLEASCFARPNISHVFGTVGLWPILFQGLRYGFQALLRHRGFLTLGTGSGLARINLPRFLSNPDVCALIVAGCPREGSHSRRVGSAHFLSACRGSVVLSRRISACCQ